MDKKTALLYVRIKKFQYLLRNTHAFIEDSLRKVKKPYLACSFGKDSAVMLHLVLQHMPDIVVRFATHPETNYLDNYESVVNEWLEIGINYEEIFCNGGLVKVRHHQRDSLNSGDWDSFFVGIRAGESFGRKVSLKKYGAFHRLANGRVKICPVAWWSENDIAAYILANDIPHLNKYVESGFSARTTSGIPRTHINECLSDLKNRDINSFNKLCSLFPDAREFV